MPPEERRRSAWGSLDFWDPDFDPALRRTNEVIERADKERAQRILEPPRAEIVPEVAPAPTPEPMAAPEESSRRERISQLIERVRAGDLGAIDALRQALDRQR